MERQTEANLEALMAAVGEAKGGIFDRKRRLWTRRPSPPLVKAIMVDVPKGTVL